jgi:proline iminopeptidase
MLETVAPGGRRPMKGHNTRKPRRLPPAVMALPLVLGAAPAVGQPASTLWPATEPYRTGHLKVSAIHEIYYQLGGNPAGRPVMVLHGGPGGSCTPADFRYFNPDRFHVVLHDQRGSGLSRPLGDLRDNTTQHLVEDTEKLRVHLGLDKVILFGGSWGSTLALAYAEAYPQHVSGIVLRGVFTATRAEIDHYYHGGSAWFFPEAHDALLRCVDTPAQRPYAAQLLEKLQSPDEGARSRCAQAWARYEGKIAFLEIEDSTLDTVLKSLNPSVFALLENYYMANACFLEEGQLLANAAKIAHIPTTIVNGRYDTVCPPLTAYRLHQKLPNSTLVIVERAGHAASEPGIQAALVKAMKAFE